MSSNPVPVPLVSAADLRHQLRTPLNHIIGYSEILLEEQSGERGTEVRLRQVVTEAKRMLETIQRRLGAEQGLVGPGVAAELRADLAGPVERVRVTVRELAQTMPAGSAADLERIASAASSLAQFSLQPLREESAAAPRWRDLPGTSRTEPGRILVVDDNETNRDMLARQLEKQHHEVETAGDGIAALERMRARPFDIVLLDLMMPGMNGFEVLQTVKRDPALSRVAVILVSALDEMDGVARSIEAGAEDYLFKPVNPTLLRARIQSTLEKMRAEEAISRKQRFESIGMLAAGIAHDFNNLLTGIIGHAQLLESVLRDPEDRQMAASILTAGERAAELTRQLLAYSGKGIFQVEELDVSSLIQGAEPLIRASLPGKIALDIRTAAVGPILADANQIRQAVLNLTLNAGEAIASGDGVVSITTGMVRIHGGERFDVAPDEVAPGDYAWLEVRDSGCGIDPELRQKIFEPFFSTKFLGRGLGLAAVAGIVRSHRGMLRVDSKTGAGACFRLYFPAIHGLPEPSGESGEAAVLVVDDEAVVRQIVTIALERAGRKVIAVDSGSAALEVFTRAPEKVGLVLLDWKMPGMDGAEALRHLRSISPNLKVIISSGLPKTDAEYHFRDAPVSGYLQKPYRMSELTLLVDAILKA